jgi:DNA invertase Pin-like site-specific DNA recombinase
MRPGDAQSASLSTPDVATMVDYVAYYRVSTEKQGKSGLGLAAQRAKIEAFLSSTDRILKEFVDIQSGRKNDRSGLNKALAFAKAKKATLLIARLDRFSRRVSFIARIMDEGISLCCAEMPNASEFQLHIFAALAQEERRLISERTKAALAEAKKRGKRLGTNGAKLALVNKRHADKFAGSVRAAIHSIGIEKSYSEIARALNEQGVRTRSGRQFYAQTVKNVALRLSNRASEVSNSLVECCENCTQLGATIIY